MALALILGASAVITGGLQSSVDSVERMRNSIHGVNLAESVLSEIQMGIIEMESVESQEFEAPFESWSYDITSEEMSDAAREVSEREVPTMYKVEVAIRDAKGEIIQRMTQYMFAQEGASDFNMNSGDGFTAYGQ